MLSLFKNNVKTVGIFVFLVAISVLSFQKNYFEFARQEYFTKFQTDSEGLVVANVIAEKFGLDRKDANLGFIKKDGEFIYESPEIYPLLGNGDSFFLTDENWDRGISRGSAGFFVPNKGKFSAAYKIGRLVEFPDGEVREIVRVDAGDSYLNVYVTGDRLSPDKVGFPSGFSTRDKDGRNESKPGSSELVFVPYKSQYGIQGLFFGKIYDLFKVDRLSKLQLINTLLLSIIFVSLFFLYQKIYDKRFAIIFLVTLVCSPWVIFFARNLYWVPFLWFLPALFAAILYLKRDPLPRALLLFAIAFAVFIKSLSGYEYLSAITLLACSVFVVAPFFRKSDQTFSENSRMFCYVFLACVIGFVCALLVHASIRGDSVIAGLKNIIDEDVKRRTYGDSSSFPEIYRKSLESSPLSVVKTYVTDWGSIPVTAWIPGYLFKFLMVFSLVAVFYKYLTRHATRHRDAVLLVFFFITSASWLVLAKGHSYIHVHLNYVLWYFGFAQVLVYISLNFMLIVLVSVSKWMNASDIKDF